MTTYQDLDWNSLNFVRQHLYRRLTTPLTHALGRMVIAQHLDSVPGSEDLQAQCRRAGQRLELALNLIKAWSALIHVKSGGTIQAEQRRVLTPAALPTWLVETLNGQTAFKAEHTLPVSVHPEAFYESLILIGEIAGKVGSLKLLLLGDARADPPGIWMRAIFDPPQTGKFAGLRGLLARLDLKNQAERDLMVQIQVLESLCAINGACLKVQTNIDTGEQALAVEFLAAPADAAVPCADSSEFFLAADWEPSKSRAAVLDPALQPPAAPAVTEIPPETLIVPPPGLRERLASITENASDTLIVPPLDLRQRLIEALNAAEAADAGAPPETLIVPPPGLHERIAAEAQAARAAPPSSGETPPETLIVPPPSLRERLGNNAFATPAAPPSSGETPPETLIVPPPSLHEKLSASAFPAAQTSLVTGETPPESVTVSPPGLRDLISARLDARAQSETPPAVSENAPEAAPPSTKSAGVEIISAENASDTVIVLPPDLQRRRLARKQAPGAADAPPDETPPAAPPAKSDP